MKTKKELSASLLPTAAPREKHFASGAWRAGFERLLRAPWRAPADGSSDPVDELRSRVEHHLLNGKATLADALMTAMQEDPALYDAAMQSVSRPPVEREKS